MPPFSLRRRFGFFRAIKRYIIFVLHIDVGNCRSLRFNVKLSEVWKGSLKSGAEVFHHLRLSSIGGVLLKPLSL